MIADPAILGSLISSIAAQRCRFGRPCRVVAEFEKALSMALFLLGDHASIEESRLRNISAALRESLEERIDVGVMPGFLETGIVFFKRNDRRALLKSDERGAGAICQRAWYRRCRTTLDMRST